MAQSYQYYTSKGKPFYTDKKLSDDELDELLSEMETEEIPVTEPTPKMSVTLPPNLGNVPPVIDEPTIKEPSMLQQRWDAINQPIVNLRGGEFGQATEEFA